MAVVEWHREAGSKELHNPCVLYREVTLAGYTDVLGKASHKADCCCILTIAIAQTLQQYCIRGTQATAHEEHNATVGQTYCSTLPVQDFCRTAVSSFG